MAIIGCGGIADAADAYKHIRAGASLVELYTAMVYAGPAVSGGACAQRGGGAGVLGTRELLRKELLGVLSSSPKLAEKNPRVGCCDAFLRSGLW